MNPLAIDYICFAGHSHLDWGGVLETLQELKNRGHKIRILSGANIKNYVEANGLDFEDIGLGYFRPRQMNESIEDTLAYHQFNNFFDTQNIEQTLIRGLDSVKENKTQIILSDPLCKTGPLINMKTGIPYAVLGPYNYQPEGRVEDDNKIALEKFIGEFSKITERYGIKDGHKLPLVQNSPLLNIVYSIPEFDKEMHEPNITYVGSDSFPLKKKTTSNKFNVFYSSGTIFWDQQQVDAVLRLAEEQPIYLHITKGRIIPHIDALKNVTIYDFCEDKKLIPEMDILITQGGLGTVTNGIRAGKPLIVMPLFWYNEPQAIKVARYGNGISIRNLDDQKKHLTETFKILTSDNTYTQKALELREKYASFGGSKKAADLITELI